MKTNNRRPIVVATTMALLLLACAPLVAMTAEDVAAKNVEARGGKDAWNAVESLELKGTFQAFSRTNPFTLVRKGRMLHMDHMLGDKLVVMGYDGEQAWWINNWMMPGPQAIAGADRAVFERDLDFPNPFFDHEARGHALTLVGETEIEGQTLLQIDIKRADDSEETWFLDPETYLEVFRDSPGSDFGRAQTQRTFFDDFRAVGDSGIVIPHYTETQWYTRYRVMEVAEAAVNVAVDDKLFSWPPPPGMENFVDLGGTWDVKYEQRMMPQQPMQEGERTSVITLGLGMTLLEERYTTGNGTEVVRTLSYDRYKEVHRLTTIDARTGLLDIYEGGPDEQGRLVVSNLESGTPFPAFGQVFSRRMTFDGSSPDAFEMTLESTIDGGETWYVGMKAVYTRQPDDAP